MPRGQITSVVADKGFGFIKPESGGDDLFFHNSTVNHPFDSLAVGQQVDFEVDGAAAKPRARKVTLTGEVLKKTPGQDRETQRGQRSPNKFDRKGGDRGGRFDRNSRGGSGANRGAGRDQRGGPGRGKPNDRRSSRPAGPPIEVKNGVPGTIASVVPDKGFGFIKPTSGGDDLFFHHSSITEHLETLVPGQQVEFELDTSSEKPRAAKVALRGERLTNQSSRGSGPPMTLENGAAGKIASVAADKGFGFIVPADGGDDLFFHHTAVNRPLESLRQGQQVEFELDTRAEKPRASKVLVRGESGGRGSAAKKRTPNVIDNGLSGTVSSIVVDKGFGFITPDDGGDELFFHDSVIDRGLDVLVSGQEVEYEIDQEAEKPRAGKVAVCGEILTKESVQANRVVTPIQNGRRGEVASIVIEKGFGFIRPMNGGDDLFFHNSTVDHPFEMLAVGQAVEYEIDRSADKPRAKKVAVRGEILKSNLGNRAKVNYARDRFENGFVTKILWKTRQGFISADAGGAELLFEQNDVVGEKKYPGLTIGDYVEFVRTGEIVRTKIDKAPAATAVRVIEKEPKKLPMKELPNNPKSRRKKPTWRR